MTTPSDSSPDGNGGREYELDVRTIEGEPFGEIMASLERLSGDDTLLLINSFEPKPLYTVLTNQGFEYEVVSGEGDEWRIAIRRADP